MAAQINPAQISKLIGEEIQRRYEAEVVDWEDNTLARLFLEGFGRTYSLGTHLLLWRQEETADIY